MLTSEQQHALDLMHSGQNVFLTGQAGTGKSFVVQTFKREAIQAVFLAPTGLAAVHIGGSTIHRFFSFPIWPLDLESLPPLSNKTRLAIRQVKTFLIDEISMVRADLMQAIDARCREACDYDAPFGGKQIIAVGDFFQLPPVVSDPMEQAWLNQTFGGNFAFKAPAWQHAQFQVVNLITSHRQVDNDGFLTALNQLREGNAAGLDYINTEAVGTSDGVAVTLCTTNRTADERNATALDRINAPSYDFQAVVTGRFKPTDAPAPAMLSLKVGARVMVVANIDGVCANGECGVVRSVSDQSDTVTIKLDAGREVTIDRKLWQSVEYSVITDRGRTRLEPRVTGTYNQFPLRLSWAMTIHKSQGQTLDHISIDLGRGTFADGQLYVALSRVRSIKSLHLKRPLRHSDVLVSSEVCDFFKSLMAPSPQMHVRSWGGRRANAGRKAQWPKGTVLKTMRLPADLEDEIRQFALEKITERSGTNESYRFAIVPGRQVS